MRRDWAAVIRLLERRQCMRVDVDDQQISLTPLGKAAAQSGITVRQAAKLRVLVDRHSPERQFGWIAVALAIPDWPLPAGMLSRLEHRQNLPVKMLYQRFDHSVEEAVPLLPENHRRQPLSYREAAALKALLLLDDWCRLTPVQKLEERYQLHLGQILSLGETAAHLVNGIAAMIEAGDLENPAVGCYEICRTVFATGFRIPSSNYIAGSGTCCRALNCWRSPRPRFRRWLTWRR